MIVRLAVVLLLAIGFSSACSAPPQDSLATHSAATVADEITDLRSQIADLLASGALNAGQANALLAKLDAAEAALARGDTNAALNQLGALVHQVEAFVRSGNLTAAQGADLLAGLQTVREQIRVPELIAAMQSNLRSLAAAEEAYFADHGAYSSLLAELVFTPFGGVIVVLTHADSTTWGATASHPGTTVVCSDETGVINCR